MQSLLLLAVAIVIEVTGSAALKASQGFSKPLPSIVVVISAIATFYLLGIIVNRLPLGIVYATWSGVGTALTAVIGVLVFRETLVSWQIAGIGLIIAGVILLNLPAKPRTDPGAEYPARFEALTTPSPTLGAVRSLAKNFRRAVRARVEGKLDTRLVAAERSEVAEDR